MTIQVIEHPPGVAPPPTPEQVTTPAPEPEPQEAQESQEAVVPPLATTGQMATWLGQLEAAAAREPLSITIAGITRQVHVHLGTLEDFHAWSDGLHAGNTLRDHDELMGWGIRAALQLAGWNITVRFYGPAVIA